MFLLFSLCKPLHKDINNVKQLRVINGSQYADYSIHDTLPSWYIIERMFYKVNSLNCPVFDLSVFHDRSS